MADDAKRKACAKANDLFVDDDTSTVEDVADSVWDAAVEHERERYANLAAAARELLGAFPFDNALKALAAAVAEIGGDDGIG